MVLKRNHRFLPPQIFWIVDFNSVCFILIRGSSFITEIDHRSDHRCLLPPLSPTGVLSAFLARRRRRRPTHGSTQWRRPAHEARLFPGSGGALPRPANRARLFSLPRRRGLHASLPRSVRTVLPGCGGLRTVLPRPSAHDASKRINLQTNNLLLSYSALPTPFDMEFGLVHYKLMYILEEGLRTKRSEYGSDE